jgi:hypothetical protein
MNPTRHLIESPVGMDHRWGRRQPTDIAVRFAANAGVTGNGRVLNISLTGAYLETRVPLRLLSLVYLEPDTPSGEDIRRCIAASVVRQDALGVGLEWCDFSTAAMKLSVRLAVLTGGDCGEKKPPTIRRRLTVVPNPDFDDAGKSSTACARNP